MPTPDENRPETEIDPRHVEQARKLLHELGQHPGQASISERLAAYNAVLAKETLWVMTELLEYKRREVHT